MPAFRYRAARSDGQVIEGTLQAVDRQGAARQLQAQGDVPLQIDTGAVPTAGPASGRAAPKVGAATVDFFTLELSTLLQAGLPLSQALDTLAGLAEEPALAAVTAKVNAAVRSGQSLSEALAAAGSGFDPFYCNMVRAGESSGALDLALERLASFRAARRALRQSLLSALIYPAILLLLALVAVGVLLAFVVPQFTELFAEAGRDLPLLTRIVAGSGEFVTRWWWLMLSCGAGLGWWLYQDWHSAAGRARWDARLLALPLVGGLLRKLDTARFARTLATLLGNGVNLVPALEIARQIIANTVLAQGLAQVTRRVREGAGLAAPLAEARLLPPLATQLIRVGESSGRLEPMLTQLAGIYERDVQTTLKRLLTLAEPAIIIGIALLITLIILSVVLMILESNDLAF